MLQELEGYELSYKHAFYGGYKPIPCDLKLKVLTDAIAANTTLPFRIDLPKDSWSGRVRFQGIIVDQEIKNIRKSLNCERWQDWHCEGGWVQKTPIFYFCFDFTRL